MYKPLGKVAKAVAEMNGLVGGADTLEHLSCKLSRHPSNVSGRYQLARGRGHRCWQGGLIIGVRAGGWGISLGVVRVGSRFAELGPRSSSSCQRPRFLPRVAAPVPAEPPWCPTRPWSGASWHWQRCCHCQWRLRWSSFPIRRGHSHCSPVSDWAGDWSTQPGCRWCSLLQHRTRYEKTTPWTDAVMNNRLIILNFQGDGSGERKDSRVRPSCLLSIGKIQLIIQEVRLLEFLIQGSHSCFI